MSIAIRPFAALLKREIWEHRAFWIVPAIIACLLTVMGLYHLTFGEHVAEVVREIASAADQLAGNGFAERTSTLSALYLAQAAVFSIGLGFALAFYLLDALYADRRDRSFLFWKSMPVSDLSTVLSKLVTALVTAPLITLGVVGATALVWSSILSGVALLGGADAWWVGLNPLALLDFAATGLAGLGMCALIAAPFVGYLLLVSAFAKRAPFLHAVLPPLLVAWAEDFLFDTDFFVETIGLHLERMLQVTFDAVADASMHTVSKGERVRLEMIDVQVSPAAFAEPGLWIGLIIAAAFIAGAVWVRRFRDEA